MGWSQSVDSGGFAACLVVSVSMATITLLWLFAMAAA